MSEKKNGNEMLEKALYGLEMQLDVLLAQPDPQPTTHEILEMIHVLRAAVVEALFLQRK